MKKILPLIAIVIVALSIAFGVGFGLAMPGEDIVIISLGCILGLFILYTAICAVWYGTISKSYAHNHFEYVITSGKQFLDWVIGNGHLHQSLYVELAASYLSIGEEENFSKYINLIHDHTLEMVKSYWVCIHHFLKGDLAEFDKEYQTVFLQIKLPRATEATETYKTVLGLISKLFHGDKLETAEVETLNKTVKNTHVKAALDKVL